MADEREFSGTTLANGLKCIFVSDPRMHKFAVQLDIGGGCANDPVGLGGLAKICLHMTLRGSARFPGVDNLLKFALDNDITHRCGALISHSYIAAELPHSVFDEYLDRLSDMVSNPEFTQKGLDFCKLRYGKLYHSAMVDVTYRVNQVKNYLLCGQLDQASFLFQKPDLLLWLRQYFGLHYRPSNMVIYTVANLPIESMKERVHHYFGEMVNKDDRNPSIEASLTSNDHFYKTLQVQGHALLAKTYIKTEEKQLSLAFPLASNMKTSSPLYICYFLNMSQPKSLQHKLKSERLISYITSEHKTQSRDLQMLEIKLSLTKKGFDSFQIVLSYVFGYLEVLKHMQPSGDYFQQARVYFQCKRRLDSSIGIMDRYSCELLMGSKISDLRDAEIPRVFDSKGIRKVFECLTIPNCLIVVVSDQYVDTPLLKGSEYFLQFSTEKFFTLPRYDGLAKPQVDSLVVSSHLPVVADSELHVICERPVVYKMSTAGEVYSMLNIGITSLEFVKLPVLVQKLYAEMVNYKLWLETTKDICEVSIKVAENGLNIDVKSVPHSLSPLIRLLVKYLSSPIGSEHENHLMTRKNEEIKVIRSRLAGEQEIEYNPEYASPSHCNIDLETQFKPLENVQSMDDLPTNIEGDLVLVFSGNVTKTLSLEVISTLSILQIFK